MKLIQMANSIANPVVASDRINFGLVDRRINGNCNTFTNTDTTISINQSGYYEVNVSANFVPSAAGLVSIELYEGTTPIPTAIASTTGVIGDTYNLNFSKIIRVLPNCCGVVTNIPTVLSVVNTGVAGSVSTFNISVKKVG